MTRDYLKNKTKNLPQKPGIYIFRGPAKEYLYIGKASNLKSRVSSYLKTEDVRIQKMLSLATSLDHKTTDSDIEALILESQLIKKLRPAFNIMMRDDKQYFFVLFTPSTGSWQAKDEFPKIFLTHQPQKNEDTIGPFTDGNSIKVTLRLLRRIFPYCTCKQTHHNYCLNYHIGKCPGFCCLKKPTINDRQLSTYNKNIKAIKDVLSGKKRSLIKQFEKEMKILGKEGKFEEAQELQIKIEKIKREYQNAQIIINYPTETTSPSNNNGLKELANILKLKIIPHRIEAYDIANIQGQYAVGVMIAFENGQPSRNEYRKFKIYTKNSPNDTAMLSEVLTRRFKHQDWSFPGLVLVDGGKGQLSAAMEAVPRNIPIIALTKDDQHRGTKLYIQNRQEVPILSSTKSKRQNRGSSISKSNRNDLREIGTLSLRQLPPKVKNLLLHLDSEAHRFAISYYRYSHRKSTLK